MARYVDLHIHSIHSDGLYSPAELVTKAANEGLQTIALADHDSVDGIDEAIEAGRLLDIEVLPAVELSVEYGQFHDVHLLGYLVDHHDQDFVGKLSEFRARRDERGREIIKKINDRLLRNNQQTISYTNVVGKVDGALGRPHIARELVARGLARDLQDAFVRYLGPCDVPKQYFPMNEALAEIRRIGGIAVLAHPFSISDNRETVKAIIKDLAGTGLDGIEVFNNMCYKEDIAFLAGLAEESRLIATGGSDYHGGDEGLEIGRLRCGLKVDYTAVDAIRSLHIQRKNQ